MFLFSAGLVSPVKAAGASLYFSPSSGSYSVGQNFSINIKVNTDGAAINAAQSTVYFPSDKLKVVKVSKSNSIFSMWVKEPVYSNRNGTVVFGGGLPSPGYTGTNGRLLNITFQGKSPGQAKVYFEGEAILADDGRGTNIFSSSYGAVYSISKGPALPARPKVPIAPEVVSPTHPQIDRWYNNNNPEFKWDVPSGITGISSAFNQDFIFDPGPISEEIIDSRSYENTEDGIWYFHLKFRNREGWGEITHRKAQIDTQPPHAFEITVDNEGDNTNPSPLLYFEAEDDTSGINHYEIKIGEQDILTLIESRANPYKIPCQYPGIYDLEVKALDYAGNTVSAFSEIKIESIAVPEITVCPETFISGQEVLYMEGIALVNHDVIVFFEKDGKLVKKWETKSNENGYWSISEDGLFKSGKYIVSARARDDRGAISNPSEKRYVKVTLSGISVGPWVISYFSISLILFAFFLILLILLIYLFSKILRTRKTIEIETKDLKKKFYKEYNELCKDIERQLKMFRKAKQQRGLTKKEKDAEAELLKNLADIERVIKEELKDIEEI
ncbi:hypothetical protein AMJ49_05160 [Parcubacteria bacterium DG_74_2]|nr:MAG: hypothetical protein AMJ49_05160 [Parcubacteria bacterium DG_74_2]